MSYIIEKDWITEAGLRAVIIMCMNDYQGKQYRRHRCGYVGVGKDTKLYGKDYLNELLYDTSVHGGLTYAEGNDNYPVEADLWWLGFDCAHLYDCSPIDPYPYMTDAFEIRGVVRTLEYCEAECELLARQLKEIIDSES